MPATNVVHPIQEGIGRLRMEAEWLSFGAGADVFFEKEVFANRVSVGEVKYIKFNRDHE